MKSGMNQLPSRASRSFLHLPDIHIIVFGAALFIPTLTTIMHLQLPSKSGQAPQDDFRGSFRVQSLHVPKGEERAAPDDADDPQSWDSHYSTKYVNVTVWVVS